MKLLGMEISPLLRVLVLALGCEGAHEMLSHRGKVHSSFLSFS